MSIKLCQDKVNRINREIADIDKKIGQYNKDVVSKNSRILQINKSMKNVSLTTLKSRLNQIEHLNKDVLRIQGKIADLQKKLGVRRNDLVKANVQLQKELDKETKKQVSIQNKLYESQQTKIQELTSLLETVILEQTGGSNLYNDIVNDVIEYDVFISHASEDKLSYVNDLVKELEDRGFSVWYDKESVVWGDSIRSRIDNGLKRSKFGIVILSESYFQKYWTQYELDGLFNKETQNGKVILPIWHNVTYEQVANYSYSLAGRDALNTDKYKPKDVADALESLIDCQ